MNISAQILSQKILKNARSQSRFPVAFENLAKKSNTSYCIPKSPSRMHLLKGNKNKTGNYKNDYQLAGQVGMTSCSLNFLNEDILRIIEL